MGVVKWNAAVVLLLCLTHEALGTHFRGAMIMMRPSDSGYEREVRVVQMISASIVLIIQCLGFHAFPMPSSVSHGDNIIVS